MVEYLSDCYKSVWAIGNKYFQSVVHRGIATETQKFLKTVKYAF